MSDDRSIIFFDKRLLGPAEKTPYGVEVFNLNLIKDLAAAGHSLVVVAHETWGQTIRKWNNGHPVEIVHPPLGSQATLGGALTALSLGRRRFAVLLLGNVGSRLSPALLLLRKLGVAERCVLIAHREPTARFVHSLRTIPTAVLAVNSKIAAHFDGHFSKVAVHYGVTDADQFYPRPVSERQNGSVNFCVLGHLDRKWKGADTAIAAFRRLPAETQQRCRLHLASYDTRPAFDGENISAYAWMPFEQMGEFLRRMDVMIVPSRDENVMRETFSQAAVQGMLTGLPLVVSDLPVLVEKVDRGGGLVFRSVDDLTQAMLKLAGDPAWRAALGAQCRQTALSRYVWNTAAFVDEFLFPAAT